MSSWATTGAAGTSNISPELDPTTGDSGSSQLCNKLSNQNANNIMPNSDGVYAPNTTQMVVTQVQVSNAGLPGDPILPTNLLTGGS